MSADILKPLILASASPRRAMLLRQIGVEFEVMVSDAGETAPVDGDFASAVIRNAIAKAEGVRRLAPGRRILGADTLVDLDGESLGKPTGADEARAMLQRLSGREHLVHTGIALLNSTGVVESACVTTLVEFRNLSDAEIEDYIATGEPFDKAGAYGIQGRGALFVARVDGCFFNVMGLPLARLWEMLPKG